MSQKQRLAASALLVLSLAAVGVAQEGRRRRPPRAREGQEPALKVKLGEGRDKAPAPDSRPKPAPATPLPAEDAKKVFDRLPKLAPEPGEAVDFAKRPDSPPAPLTGKTIKEPFPAEEPGGKAPEVEKGDVEVLRVVPEGEVPLAPRLSITFSRPMVALSSQAEVAKTVPAKLTPETPGEWRWLGTKTLVFAPKGRFPMATTYTVEVPEGVASVSGAKLAKTQTFTFATPPPRLVGISPASGPAKRDPIVYLTFDQKIDPAAVLATVELRDGSKAYELELAAKDAVAADDVGKQLLALPAQEGRWLALRAKERLPFDAEVKVSVGPGTPSSEGPRKTETREDRAFRTYGKLRVRDRWPRPGEETYPYGGFSIQMTNPLDPKAWDPRLVKVEPALDAVKVEQQGTSIGVRGNTRARTTYKVTVAAALKDVFGETLEEDTVLDFKVGPAPKRLMGTGGLVVLDPWSASRAFSVYSVNHAGLKVRAYSVDPSTDFPAFVKFLREWNQSEDDAPPAPGKLMLERTIAVKAEPDQLAETAIDLAPGLDEGLGHLVIFVEPDAPRPKNRWERQAVVAWVQATYLGLDAFVDREQLLGWATSLKEGKPLEGVALSVIEGAEGTTGQDGLAALPLAPRRPNQMTWLVAKKGRDSALLPENLWGASHGWQPQPAVEHLLWYVFDDRHMYRPGEKVHVKGWIRRTSNGKRGDVDALDGKVDQVQYRVTDSRGNEVAKGTRAVGALGGFDLAFDVPPTANLGASYVQLEARRGGVPALPGARYNHAYEVQEFRRPEFEVTCQASEGPHLLGGSAIATVKAAYYAGGGLQDAPTSWWVTVTPTTYVPPNRGEWVFGRWVPWWLSHGDGGEGPGVAYAGRTDAEGAHRVKIDFDSMPEPRPVAVVANATVTDVNRQGWASRANLLVHPSLSYVGLKLKRAFFPRNEPVDVEALVCDLDGKLLPGSPIAFRCVRLDWTLEGGQWKEVEEDPEEKSVDSKDEPVRASFTPKEGGRHRLVAIVKDAKGRPNRTELTFWVAGGKLPPSREVTQEQVQLIPDKKDYKVGDTAEVLVQAPFFPAEGILTLRRSGVVKTERFRLETPTHTLKIPVLEEHIPNVLVCVDLVGATARTKDSGEPDPKLPKRPAFAAGALDLPVPPLARKLAVAAKPRDAVLEPGAETTVDIEVRDAAGKPVEGEVAVAVVDEAILALSGYRVPDALTAFHPRRSPDTGAHHLRAHVKLADPTELAETSSKGAPESKKLEALEKARAPGESNDAMGVGGGAGARRGGERLLRMADAKDKDGGGGEEEAGPVKVRSLFDPLAAFAPAVATDANGKAEVKVKLPDSLTRYRVVAVAVSGGKQYGQSEATIVARLPLMVRPSAPRFLNFGDRFELPVVVQNQSERPLVVDVVARAVNAEIGGTGGFRVTVPANDRVEIRFPAAAARAGHARFQVGGVSGAHSDAALVKLPVWTPATSEAFATYGELDEGVVLQKVRAPGEVWPQFGGLEVTTSSTAVAALTDAFLYLMEYPFECSEQVASRVVAVAALKDVLGAFKAKGLPSPEEVQDAMKRDVTKLAGMQNRDGGWGFWRAGVDSWPYLGIHVTHALVRAKEKGFDVPKPTLDRAHAYLKTIEQRYPPEYGPEIRRTLTCYALYVRTRLGDRDTARARGVVSEAGGADKLPIEAAGWLLSVVSGDEASAAEVAAIRRHLSNRVTEEAGTAHFATSYTDGAYLLLHSDRRADGVVLEALIGDQPKSDVIPKVVRGLLAHRKAGRWANTQENAFVLIALDRYFATYEKETPDFVARAWLGDTYAGEHEFRGRQTDRHQVSIPLKALVEGGGEKNLVLSKEGPGRLYYRVGLKYAPASLKLDPMERGFTVTRAYEAVDDPKDVERREDGSWRMRAGARVRVRLAMVAPTRRYHVALVDPLPAGLEPMNPSLAVTGPVPRDPKAEAADASKGRRPWWWWNRPWFEHQNMRDERVEAFASLLWEGVHEYTYVARATTPGNFVVPPPKAEEMYQPEVFGRGATDRVTVE